MPDLIPTLVMSALVYTKSYWSVIRGNAAMLIGKDSCFVNIFVLLMCDSFYLCHDRIDK